MIGYHVSADRPLAEVERRGGDCAQVFLGNPIGWKFAGASDRRAELPTWVHGAYLINVASDSEQVRQLSWRRLRSEVTAAAEYGAQGVVVHPGGAAVGWDQAAALWLAWRRWAGELEVPVILECSAGPGVAQSPERLGALAGRLSLPVCVDTAHVWGAGYRLERYVRVVRSRAEVGLIHLNDSLVEFGRMLDRHAPFGHGVIPRQAMLEVLSCNPGVPVICETATDTTAEEVRRELW